ncbi:MAG TPA: MFS transporter [Lacunisphaera sp.]|nr:MFS transporter [Lacunisphaera sp.]
MKKFSRRDGQPATVRSRPVEKSAGNSLNAWRWIPTLYFCEGIPNVVVTSVAVVMFKNLKVSNTDIALFTSLAYLPWVIKPLWSPLVDLFGTKRRWIVLLQFALGLALATMALAVPGPDFFCCMLAVLWLLAFFSATHDVAADGFYLLALPPHQQAAFVGVRNTCFRLATLAGKGGLVGLSGWLLGITGSVTQAWSGIFILLAALFFLAGFYHLWSLPVLADDHRVRRAPSAAVDFLLVFKSFFAKPGIGIVLSFLLLYRLAEALALKLVEPFLLDARAVGGLGLTNGQLGLVNGTFGVMALLAGGLLGGYLISRRGLRRMLWPMILVMHVPIATFLLLALTQPTSLIAIGAALTVEQFGYGFGFTAYMVYMMMIAEGEHKTAHYAICTGFMALGLLLPGMAAGWIQEKLGYVDFFVWACVATLPSFAAAALLKIDPAFGRKT